MDSINPRIVFQVDNKLVDDDSKMNLELKFNHMDDFNPVAVLKQIKPLKKLYDARQRLSDLLTKLDGNDDLDDLLQEVLQSTENLEELKTLTAPEEGDDEGGDEGGDDAADEPAEE